MVSGFDFSKKWCTSADVGNVLDPTPVSRRLVVVTVLGVVVAAIVANGTLPTPACTGFGVVHAAGSVMVLCRDMAVSIGSCCSRSRGRRLGQIVEGSWGNCNRNSCAAMASASTTSSHQ